MRHLWVLTISGLRRRDRLTRIASVNDGFRLKNQWIFLSEGAT